MKCIWEDVPGSETEPPRPDPRTWRYVRCVRCGKPSKGPTPHTFDRIDRDCFGWPLPHEHTLWLALFSEAVGITQARAAYARWTSGGAKVADLPVRQPAHGLTPAELAELFPGDDPTLIGNRIAALTTALGIPPCGGCGKRKEYLNKAHAYIRATWGSVVK